MTVIIDHERYGDKSRFHDLTEAQAAIRDCGPDFANVSLSVMPCGIVVDQTGDEVGHLEDDHQADPSQVRDDIDAIFGRLDADGNIRLLYETDGTPVTRLLVDGVYPVGSPLSTQYEHPEGLVLTRADAEKLGIEIEGN